MNQKQRAEILFYLYPDIHAAYQLAQQPKVIFEQTKDKIYAYTKLAKWHETVNQAVFKSFNSISRTIQNHYKTVLMPQRNHLMRKSKHLELSLEVLGKSNIFYSD